MTVAVASYQRRDPLLRLLRGLDAQLAADGALREDLSVVVVLDGSTDGSREAVEGERWSVPVDVRWQPNRGLAAARNVGLAAAAGGLVWFLDDDLVPGPGLVERHRHAHGAGPPGVVVGPCRIPPDVAAPAPLVRWWDEFYRELAAVGTIDRFDRFTTANASGPAALFSAVGGFDESFVEYGLEDYELAVRLLAAGTPLRFDVDAVAWHPDVPPMPVLLARQRAIGANAVRLARRHPQMIPELFPLRRGNPYRRLLRDLRLRRPRSLMAMCHLASWVRGGLGWAHPEIRRHAESLARTAAQTAGVASADPDGALLDRMLGYRDGARPRRSRSRARASRQPATSPTSSDNVISR